METTTTQQSTGHIAFVYPMDSDQPIIELFQFDGQVYRASTDLPVMPDGRRCGRWECSRDFFALHCSRIHPDRPTYQSMRLYPKTI